MGKEAYGRSQIPEFSALLLAIGILEKKDNVVPARE
jgi:hypothetical protein